MFEALAAGLVGGLVYWLSMGTVQLYELGFAPELVGLELMDVLVPVLLSGLSVGLLAGWSFRRSAISTRLTFVWPSTRQRLLDFLRSAAQGMIFGLVLGLGLGLVFGVTMVLYDLAWGPPDVVRPGLRLVGILVFTLVVGLVLGLMFGLVLGLVFGLTKPRSVLITSRTPKEASSRSQIAAWLWLVLGLMLGLVFGVAIGFFGGGPYAGLELGLSYGLELGLALGPGLGLRNGGGFVVLQKVAHRHLARAGNLPPRPVDFLEWGIEQQIFRRVGGGVRFRHNLIQQHLANS